MNTVSTPEAPPPAGHYSQAVVHGDTVYVAGQLPMDPEHPDRAPGDAAAQTEQALRNVEAILRAAGTDLSRLIQVTIYVADIGLWDDVNRVYARMLGHHRPARAVVPVAELHHGWLLEVQAVAALG